MFNLDRSCNLLWQTPLASQAKLKKSLSRVRMGSVKLTRNRKVLLQKRIIRLGDQINKKTKTNYICMGIREVSGVGLLRLRVRPVYSF